MERDHSLYSILKEQNKIIEMISIMNLPLADILHELIHTIDFIMPTIKSSIMILDEKTQSLGNGIGKKLPPGYLRDIDGLKIGPCTGSCGTAAYFKKTVIVTDAKTDPLWEPFRDISYTYNIAACWAKPLISPNNKVLGTMAFYSDENRKPTAEELELMDTFSNLAGLIILKKKTEEILHLSNTVVENSPVILMRWKAEEGWPLEYVTENVSQLGYTTQDFMSGKIEFTSIIHPDDLNRIENEVEYYSKHEIDQYIQEYRILTKDGKVKWIDDRTIIQRNEEGVITNYQGTILDITERKEAEATIKFLADNDTLTQLPNRRVFLEQLALELEEAQSEEHIVAVLFLDLDNFKDVNDSMGHHFGDQLLQNIANTLKAAISEDGFISRVSGDEFAIILSNVNDQKVIGTAKKILQIFNDPFVVGGMEFSITVSVGISLFPQHGDNPDTLLKHADLAMYSAKKQGKNCFQFYTREINESERIRKKLYKELKKALKENQFVLYFQPQLNIHTLEVTGVEALIRWDHPERGILSPMEFIPFAEESGLISAIDEWVLGEACRQRADWKKMGFSPFSMSVNLSARQFYNHSLVDDVQNLLKELELAPNDLTLEMTEGTLMTDKEKTINVLKRLGKTGVSTSLDDFGTGYSSLSYLKFLPINKLKIDRSFMSDITEDVRDAAILEAIFTLAQRLKLDVIVEGVETMEQLNYLKETSCGEAQGYFFSRPLPVSEIEGFFKRA
ncbi:diguanylate cyclase (GGDEF)-like protein/PAS domain S-box-containing protein [Evansella vedderi]|uniref:Diguanylate cyclase (GGDEF)-like protein/PAS domain S-box-containing protein n=1 Tax=Evansella vedderi TaxID=38282 RepID=A0ABT9ZR77_9BACI|nr:EAL domain-containing protein [Evansella vedderi]MDQ0253460.1 diguanylate cyclase (GGDEF)-like protein/PAS domain S-box-containing protein [Evansella vedderi]